MPRPRPRPAAIPGLLAGLALVAGLALAGCGGSSTGDAASGATPSTGPAPTTAEPAAAPTTTEPAAAPTTADPTAGPTVAVAESSLGRILVDQAGLTLYLFTPDPPSQSTCTEGCAAAWPPMDGPAAAGPGVDAARLGSLPRPDGSTQVSYAGHPLYTYASDLAPGDVEGQGLSGNWYVVGPDGEAITETASGPGRY